MTAYMIVRSRIIDEDLYARYRNAVLPLIESFGGKHLRSGEVKLLEGNSDERRMALFEFLSIKAIDAFWDSPEYKPIKAFRLGAAELEIWAVPGPDV